MPDPKYGKTGRSLDLGRAHPGGGPKPATRASGGADAGRFRQRRKFHEGTMNSVIEKNFAGTLVQVTTRTPPTHFDNRLQTGTAATLTIDVAALETDLRA